jgi:hypothetical protein
VAATTLSPASIAFGNVSVNTTSPTKTITLVNNQTSALTISMSPLSAAASLAVPDLGFTWRMNLPVPRNKLAGSGSATP